MAKNLSIKKDPDPILRQTASKIESSEIQQKNFQAMCDNMERTMLDQDGIGLAAPQVGVSQRIFIVNTKNGAVCMINPEITKRSWSKEWGEEGCLSVPNVFGRVKRHKNVVCSYLDRQGKTRQITASGLMARVIQHEHDHLNGILFTDKAKNVQPLDKEEKG